MRHAYDIWIVAQQTFWPWDFSEVRRKQKIEPPITTQFNQKTKNQKGFGS